MIAIAFRILLYLCIFFCMPPAAFGIICLSPEVKEIEFSYNDIQWEKTGVPRNRGFNSYEKIIHGLIPLVKRGLPLERLILDIESGNTSQSFELHLRRLNGEGAAFRFGVENKWVENLRVRAIYRSEVACPKYIYVFTAVLSSEVLDRT